MNVKTVLSNTIYYFESGNYTAEIELSNASFYECPKSLWSELYCFQIYDSKNNVTNLRASNLENYHRIITLLKSKCGFQLCNTHNVIFHMTSGKRSEM